MVQSFIYKEKIDRENENNQVMKIIDSNNEEEIDKFLKDQTKHIYSAEYNIENQKQIKKQLEIISSELVDKIVNAKEISEFNNLMKNGITKGYLTHKISNDSSKGYIELKKKLIDEKLDIPLRYEKLKAILSGKDEKGEDLWNNGNAIRIHRKEYQIFIQKNNPKLWEDISKMTLIHKYREKVNRQGHSNEKKSYWGFGYETLQDFYELSDKKEVERYKSVHNNCCGLGDPEKRIKNIKKAERKKKRKEFRQKRKESENANNKKDNKTDDNKMDIQSEENIMKERGGRGGRIRGRGRRGGSSYRGRVRRGPRTRKPIFRGSSLERGRGRGRGGSEHDKEDYEEMEDDLNEEEPIIGRKKKRTEKKLKQKEKEEKKINKKIKKLNSKK